MIETRLDSVEDLCKNTLYMTRMRDWLSKMQDLERLLSRLYKYSINQNQNAIYFEDVSLSKLKDFSKTLKDLKGL